MKQPKVIELVVKNDLCIGCGLCVGKCSSKALEMSWNANGFLVPQENGSCDCNGACLDVCPFNPFPKTEVRTENEIAEIFLTKAKQRNSKIGKYNEIYAGFSKKYRLSSSSGGLGTYVCATLLEKNIVDHIFSIQESKTPGLHYEYSVCSSKSDLLKASKTRYFPVSMANVFSEIQQVEGRIAVVGVGCFIKAIRLAQYADPHLKEKIPFLVGIICGGVKSKFFTEYLASKVGVQPQNIRNPEFRKKDVSSTAFDYSFSVSDHGTEKSIKMRTVGDMWGTGLFKANACDFCDDVTTELADISLGDAWLDPYDQDGKGTNVVVTRSPLANQIIQDGIANQTLMMDQLPIERFLASQQGSFNHRHTGMPTRIAKAKRNKKLVPPKRHEKEKSTLDFKLVQKQRMKVRTLSLELWKQYPNAEDFDKMMEKPLSKLRFYTKIYHHRRKWSNRKSKLVNLIKQRLFHK